MWRFRKAVCFRFGFVGQAFEDPQRQTHVTTYKLKKILLEATETAANAMGASVDQITSTGSLPSNDVSEPPGTR